jgi:hypothetical protein
MPAFTLSITDMFLNNLRFWKVRAIPAWVIVCGFLRMIGLPRKLISPELGL